MTSDADALTALSGSRRLVDANGHPVFDVFPPRIGGLWFCLIDGCAADTTGLGHDEDLLPFEVYDDE